MQAKKTITFEQAFHVATLLRRACKLSLAKGRQPVTIEMTDIDIQISVGDTQIMG